jgi:hypothetical protein
MNGVPRVTSPESVTFGTVESVQALDAGPDAVREASVTVSIREGQVSQNLLPVQKKLTQSFRRSDGTTIHFKPPFRPWFVWTPNPDGGVTKAWGGEYMIVVEAVNGDTVATLRRTTRPVGPSKAAVSAARSWLLEALSSGAPMVNRRIPELVVDAQQIVSLTYPADGRELWVGRTEWESWPVYDILVGNRVLCTVELSVQAGMARRRTQPARIVAGMVFQHFLHEELMVPFIAAYEVPEPCQAGS